MFIYTHMYVKIDDIYKKVDTQLLVKLPIHKCTTTN